MTGDPTELTASEALPRLRDGSLSAECYASACVARIAERDPLVHAWAHFDPDQVIEQARALDRRDVRGPLHGLPVGVKDIMLTLDMPTQYNSDIYAGAHPKIDAGCVSLLRAAGALVLGKTETVEFGATGRSAPTRNPHDLERTPGGSSSGSAAAVADFHVPLALGAQTGGSVIRPAAYCGVFALKPTWGLVGREGVRPFAPSLDTIGWFARSADDLALLYDVFDPEPAALPAFAIARSRIGLCRSPAWGQVDDATTEALATVAGRLRAAGAEVAELTLPAPFDDLIRLHGLIMGAEGRFSVLPEYRLAPEKLHPNLRALAENAAGVTREALRDGYVVADACRAAFDRIGADFDAILTPSVIGEAPMGLAFTGAMTCNAIWSLLHTPCVNLPGVVGSSGMPVGLTLTGPRYADRKLMAVAAAIAPLLSTPSPAR